MRSSGNDVRYAYATGRVRALESRLLGDAELGRMAEAADLHSAVEFLGDLPRYSGLSAVSRSVPLLERSLEPVIEAVRREVSGLSEDPELTDVWLARFDLSAMKRELRNSSLSPARGDDEAAVGLHVAPDTLRGVFADAAEIARRTDDPLLADARIDTGYADRLCEAAGRLGSSFLAEFAILSADLYNVRALLRARRMVLAPEKRERLFAAGGLIPLGDLMQSFRDESELPPFLSRGRYSGVLGASLSVASDTFLEQVDLLCDEALTGYMKQAKFFTFGVEPLVGYAYAVELETANVRRILTGKIMGLAPERIRERLRGSYV